jgi:CHAT domain-containing protein
MTSAPVLWKGLDAIKDFEIKRRSEALYEEDKLHLFERLWQPMESLMKDVKTVYYSPSGFLNDLAFTAFKCPDGTYLSDHYELHQMLSTGDLVSLREKPAANHVKTAMLFGSVYYSPEQEQLARQIAQGTGNRGQASEQRGAIIDDEETFGYLSFTKEEVEHVDHILKDKGIAVQQLTGFSPTEEALHAVSEKSPEVLHLSTHGFFVRDDKEAKENKFLLRFPSMQFSSMQRSGLALVGANRTWEGATDKPEEADGIITANEVALLDLSHTRLAVLSACQTAVGQYSMEGVYGMHRGFKQAGVKSILATLWNVNDKSTARLMELFYGKWLSGTPMQQSLNEAVRELRKEYPSPFYWAPFVLLDAEN